MCCLSCVFLNEFSYPGLSSWVVLIILERYLLVYLYFCGCFFWIHFLFMTFTLLHCHFSASSAFSLPFSCWYFHFHSFWILKSSFFNLFFPHSLLQYWLCFCLLISPQPCHHTFFLPMFYVRRTDVQIRFLYLLNPPECIEVWERVVPMCKILLTHFMQLLL